MKRYKNIAAFVWSLDTHVDAHVIYIKVRDSRESVGLENNKYRGEGFESCKEEEAKAEGR